VFTSNAIQISSHEFLTRHIKMGSVMEMHFRCSIIMKLALRKQDLKDPNS